MVGNSRNMIKSTHDYRGWATKYGANSVKQLKQPVQPVLLARSLALRFPLPISSMPLSFTFTIFKCTLHGAHSAFELHAITMYKQTTLIIVIGVLLLSFFCVCLFVGARSLARALLSIVGVWLVLVISRLCALVCLITIQCNPLCSTIVIVL